jgi:hypothetical protein
VVEESPLDPWAAESGAVEVKTGHCPQGLEEMAADTAETTMVHALLALAVADKMSMVYFELQVVRVEIVGLVNWMSFSTPESGQEREVQAKHDQHDLAVNRGPW